MLKKRLITTILVERNQIVRGESFNNWRRIDTVLPIIRVYTKREVDEICIIDVGASKDEYDINYTFIKTIVRESNVPVSYGGGISNIQQMRALFELGVEKVILNSILYEDIELLDKAVNLFGAQAIIVGIDVFLNYDELYVCSYKSNSFIPNIYLKDHLNRILEFSFGEILITSIDNDGRRCGYNLDLYKYVCEHIPTNIPIIASGGAWNNEDFRSIFEICDISAAAASSIYLFTHNTPKTIKRYLSTFNIPVRN
jgi:imidazole glycerol-phosphate synthase subunit HisF